MKISSKNLLNCSGFRHLPVQIKMILVKLYKYCVEGQTNSIPAAHQLSDADISEVRQKLLSWYDANKRDLPWRKQVSNPDDNQRAYAGNNNNNNVYTNVWLILF